MLWNDLYNVIRDWQVLMVLVTAAGFVLLRRQFIVSRKAYISNQTPYGVFIANRDSRSTEFDLRQEYTEAPEEYRELWTYLDYSILCSVQVGYLRVTVSRSLLSDQQEMSIADIIRYNSEKMRTTRMNIYLLSGETAAIQSEIYDYGDIFPFQYMYLVAFYEDVEGLVFFTKMRLVLWHEEEGENAGTIHAEYDGSEMGRVHRSDLLAYQELYAVGNYGTNLG